MMNMRFTDKLKKSNKEWILYFIFLGFIFAIGFYRLNEQYAPVILMDEFGYWSNAAYFSGKDWSSIAQFNTYYSYGYSLILAVLIQIFAATNILYKMAVLLNSVFISFTFLLLIQIGKFLFFETPKKWIIIYSFLAVLYPSFCANIHIAWDETLLVLAYVLCVYFLCRILMKASYINIILYAVSLIFCYITHQRGLGVIFFGCITLLLLWWNKNINWKKMLCFIVCISLLLLIHRFIKSSILDNVFMAETNTAAAVNDYGSIWKHIMVWFNPAGAKKLLISLIGKMFYLLIASSGLFGLAVFYMLHSESRWIQNFRSKELSLKQILYFFLLTSFAATILISSVYTLNATRLDVVVYGRYTEWALAPYLLIGMLAIMQQKREIAIPYLCIAITTVMMLCFITKVYEAHPEWTEFFAVCSFVMAYFKNKMQTTDYSFLYLACAVACAYMLLLIGCSRLKKVKIYLAITVLCSFMPVSFWCVKRVFGSNYRSEICLRMNEYIKNTIEDVYFVNDHGQGIWYVADMQVLNPDIEIQNISGDELDDVSGYVLIGTYDECFDESYTDNILVSNFQITLLHLDGDDKD